MARVQSAELASAHHIPRPGYETLPRAEHRIVIVGGGIFGATAALELRRRGHAVTIVDRGPLPHSEASSTDVSKMVRMDYGSDVFYHELAEHSLEGWQRWNAQWSRPLYHDDGFLVLASEEMKPGGFEYESYRLLGERGYDPERIDGRTLARRFPAWNGDEYPDGYISRPGGWVESGEAVRQLLEACSREGVLTVEGSFAGLCSEGSRVSGVRVQPVLATLSRSEPERVGADVVVVCAGAWTPVLHPVLDSALTVIAQPVLHFGVAAPEKYAPPHFLPFAADISGSGWYGFPALKDGRLKLGHHGDGVRVGPDARGVVSEQHVREARAFLRRALPALANAPVLGSRVCLYSDTVDGDLFIDADPNHEGVVVAAGGSGHGFKFAPALGGIIADVVENRDNRWRSRFRWRTGGSSAHEQARLITSRGGKPTRDRQPNQD